MIIRRETVEVDHCGAQRVKFICQENRVVVMEVEFAHGRPELVARFGLLLDFSTLVSN